jgi:DNA-binding response OmpR family regulator
MNKRQILVAEDEPAMRLALKEVLSILDEFEILEAADGEQALALIRAHQPELVLLDLLMPKLDGFDVLEALLAESEPVKSKIVVLSALTEPHLVEELAKLGAHRTMTKPLHISELLALVEEAAPASPGSLAAA